MYRTSIFALLLWLITGFSVSIRAQATQLTDLNKTFVEGTPILDFRVLGDKIITINSQFLPNEAYGLLSSIDPITGAIAPLIPVDRRYFGEANRFRDRSGFMEANEVLLARIQDEGGYYLYRIETDSVYKIADLPNGVASELVPFNDKFYFLTSGIGRFQGPATLWETDGSAAGTQVIFTFPIAVDGDGLNQLSADDQRLFIMLSGVNSNEFELWTSDGTASNTQLLEIDGNQAANFSSTQMLAQEKRNSMVHFQNAYYFSGQQGPLNDGAGGIYRILDDLTAEVVLSDLGTQVNSGARVDFQTYNEDSLLIQVYREAEEEYLLFLLSATQPDTLELLAEIEGPTYLGNILTYDNSILFCGPTPANSQANSIYQYRWADESPTELLEFNANPFQPDKTYRLQLNGDHLYLCGFGAFNEFSPPSLVRYNLITESVLTEVPAFFFNFFREHPTSAVFINQDAYFLTTIPSNDFTQAFELSRLSPNETEVSLVNDMGTDNLRGVFGFIQQVGDQIFFRGDFDNLGDPDIFSDDGLLLTPGEEAEAIIYPPTSEISLGRPYTHKDAVLANGRPDFNSPNQTFRYLEDNFELITTTNALGETTNLDLFQLLFGAPFRYLSLFFEDRVWLVDVEFNGLMATVDTLVEYTNTNVSSFSNDGLFATIPFNVDEGGSTVTVYDSNATEVFDFSIFPQESVAAYSREAAVVRSFEFSPQGLVTTGFKLISANGNPTVVSFEQSDSLISLGELGRLINDNTYVFRAASSTYGRELFAVDFNAGTIELLRDINPGPANGCIPNSLIQDSIVYFVGETPEQGAELWRTDGTNSGTYLVADINPGPGFSRPDDFLLTDDFLFFAANGPLGVEPYALKLDGSEEVVQLADIQAGTASSMPENFHLGTDGLYFSAQPADNLTSQIFRIPNLVLSDEELIRQEVSPVAYPNPTNNILRIIAPENLVFAQAQLYDQHGRLCLTKTQRGSNNQLELSLNDLPAASYWLVTTYTDGSISRQLIIKGNY